MNISKEKLSELKKIKTIKARCLHDMGFFCRYIFKENSKHRLIERKYQRQIINKLNDVVQGKIKRLIINMPPRLGKTEIAVKQFITYGFSLNAACKFIHLSYSDDLALSNSVAAKEYVTSDAFQKIWDVEIKKTSKAKKKWDTTAGGGVYATSTGGQITGFGAGAVYDEREDRELQEELDDLIMKSKLRFSGALIIDDPHKVEDSFSKTKMDKDIRRWENTIKNRINSPDIPIIIIMQRLSDLDLCKYVIDNSPYTWDVLTLKGLTSEGVSICEEVISTKQLLFDQKHNPSFFLSQYQQEPSPLDGDMIKREYFRIVPQSLVPSGLKYTMFIDGAFTEDKRNDPTGLGVFGFSESEKILYWYFANDFYKELPEAVDRVIKVANHFSFNMQTSINIEPKASGQALIPTLRKYTNIPIRQIRGQMVRISKVERVNMVLDMLSTGRVRIVEGGWNTQVINQLVKFPEDKHDEFVDVLCYAVYHHFGGRAKLITN